MPLSTGKSEETISRNIAELYNANKSKSPGKKRPRDQIIAIALSKARGSSGK